MTASTPSRPSTSVSQGVSQMSPGRARSVPDGASAATRSSATGLLLEKSSTTTTSQPACSRSTAVWLPM
jgi:hypothetical protein